MDKPEYVPSFILVMLLMIASKKDLEFPKYSDWILCFGKDHLSGFAISRKLRLDGHTN